MKNKFLRKLFRDMESREGKHVIESKDEYPIEDEKNKYTIFTSTTLPPNVSVEGLSIDAWSTMFPPMSLPATYPFESSYKQIRASTEFDPIRAGIEEMVDTRLSESMPILKKIVGSMIDEKIEQFQLSLPIQEVEPPVNVFEIPKEKVKDTILKTIKIGEVFYPSEIANQFGLDLKMVIEVIDELKREGKISDNQTSD